MTYLQTTGLMFLLVILIGGVIAYKDDKRTKKQLKEFRRNLKVGDETDQGLVIDIRGYHVYTEKITRIENIYPHK